MAPTRSRKQPSRQADYTNIGVAGRKTGITLEDRGVRDEHGMEPIEGIFSSPTKAASTPQQNDKATANGGDEDEQDMSIGNSTVPEPTEVLSTRRVALPPPRSRSPIKTHLNSFPRRLAGITSSPLKARRQNNFNDSPVPNGDESLEIEAIPVTAKPASDNTANTQKPRANMRSLVTAKKRKRGSDAIVNEAEEEIDHAITSTPNEPRKSSPINEPEPETLPADETPLELPELEAGSPSPQVPVPKVAKKAQKKPGRAKVVDLEDSIPSPGEQAVTATTAVAAPKARRGRPPKVRKLSPAPVVEEDVVADEDPEPIQTKKKKKEPAPSAKAQQPPPSQRNPRARVTGSKKKRPEPPQPTDDSTEERGKPKSRGLLLLHSETPVDDTGATVMRSGRTSVKPLAFWRNERIVYDRHNIDGVRLPLQGMKQVIRTEEAPATETKPKKRTRKIRPASKIIEEDEDQEEWERETGVLEGSVMQWDPDAQKAIEGDLVDTELAYAAKGLTEVTREVKNATFLYGKTVTLPFFHSGVVDLPPQGEKRMKNSRKNHMVFWVFSGRVDIDVSENQFSVGQGGMWQVPRGNFYSLSNPHDVPARVFFAQGCYMTEKEGGDMSE